MLIGRNENHHRTMRRLRRPGSKKQGRMEPIAARWQADVLFRKLRGDDHERTKTIDGLQHDVPMRKGVCYHDAQQGGEALLKAVREPVQHNGDAIGGLA